jgi:WD40 repeat protein
MRLLLVIGIVCGLTTACARTAVRRLVCSYDEQAAAAAGQAVKNGHRGPVRSLFFTADGAALYSSGWGGQIRVWDLASGQTRELLPRRDGPAALALAEGQQALAIAVEGAPDLTLFNLRRGEEVPAVAGGAGLGLRPYAGHSFSRDGALIAVPGAGNDLRLWNIKVGQVEAELAGHGGRVNDLCFTADSERLVSAGEDGSVRVWNTSSGEQIEQHTPHGGAPVRSVDLTADDRLMVTADSAGHAFVSEVATGQFLVELDPCRVAGDRLRNLRFSPDAKAVFGVKSDCSEQFVCVWDATSGAAVAAIEIPVTTAIDFTADGKLMATGGCGCEIILWDLESGAPVGVVGDTCRVEVEATCD